MHKALLCALCGALLATLVASPAFAGVAVSGVNGKVEGIYGNVDADETKAAAASLSLPLCPYAGAQLDTAFGEIGQEQLKGVGLHLFARDSERYLLGIVGSYAELEDTALERYAVEGEAYFGPLTLAAIVGHQTGDVEDTGFGTLDLRWYPLENLMVEAGGSIADSDDDRLHIGAEVQIVAGLSAFADFAAGENDYEHALFGAKYYFGSQKTLVKRHREDDPANSLVDGVIQSLTSFREPAASHQLAGSATDGDSGGLPPVGGGGN